jgi:hypothetical protein
MDARELVKEMLFLEMKDVGFHKAEQEAIRKHINLDEPLKRWLWSEWGPYFDADDWRCSADGLRDIISGYVVRANYYGRCRESVRRLYENEINFYRTTLPKYKKMLKRLK